ncbi:MAG: cell division protein ZapA [Eubacteriales bacterium]
MKNTVVIQILDQPYSITADETREYMEEVGARTNQEMRQIASQSGHSPKMNIAVLAALNLCDRWLKSDRELREVRQQLERMEAEEQKQIRNDDEARKEIYRLRTEVTELRQKLKKQEASQKAGKQAAKGETGKTE